MSFTITTDVFCDGKDCSDWIHGACGKRVLKQSAMRNAKAHGWVSRKGQHLCPDCAKKKSAAGEEKA